MAWGWGGDGGAITISINGSSLNSDLLRLLMCDDISPGAEGSYQLMKTIYCDHPLGRKMAEAPITMAQSQAREVAIQEAPPEVAEAFKEEWEKIGADKTIHNLMRLSRVYGLATVVAISDQVDPGKPFDMKKIYNQEIFFNVLDPLNTAGSLVLNQIPTAKDFNKPVSVVTNGQKFHPSRFIVMMNEEPVYLQYTNSAFGFVGRSVYQRALYALKSYIRSMIANDMILTKLGLLIAKQKSPGSVITRGMEKIAGVKRQFLKEAQTGNVLSIDVEEAIETLNMQNVEGAGTYARTNVLKDVATAADMPAKILENETMVAGFGEGTEDAKNIAAYIDSIRKDMKPPYAWFDNIVQYRAWNVDFYQRIQAKYPKSYGNTDYEDAFSQWRRNFAAEWPSVLRESESELAKSEKTKFEAIISLLQTLLPELDPVNKRNFIENALENIGDNKIMFPHEFNLDYDTLLEFLETKQQQGDEAKEIEGEAAKFGKFG